MESHSNKAPTIIKIAACCCFALIAVASLLAWNSPATGYEPDIYKATPALFWAFLILSGACGIGIIVHQVYTRQHETSRLWLVGLLLTLFSNTALLCLPAIRNYALWGYGDPATHLGEIKNIVAAGYVTYWAMLYPVAHIYAAQTSLVYNLDPSASCQMLPYLFGLIFLAFMYLLGKSVLPQKGAVILVTVAVLALAYGNPYFIPNELANLLFPMALFLLVKSLTTNSWQWRALFILMVLLYPVFHAVPAVGLAVVLVTMPLARLVFDKIAKVARPIFDSSAKFSLIALALLVVWGGGWVSSFPRVHRMGLIVAEDYSMPEMPSPIAEPSPVVGDYPRPEPYTLETAPAPGRTSGGGVPIFVSYIEDIRYAQAYGYSAAKHIFNLYGTDFLYILLALIAFPILWRRARTDANLRNLACLYGPLAAIAVMIVALCFTAFGFGALRPLAYIILICTIFVGFVLYEIMERGHDSQHKYSHILAPVLVAIILIGAFGNGVGRLYASPHTLSDNYQVTQTEINGMDWLFSNKDQTLAIIAHCLPPGRFADFLVTHEESSQRQDIPRLEEGAYSTLPHFGYHKGAWLGEYYTEDTYMLLSDRDRLRYVKVYPELAKYRYYPEDFERLEQDITVDKLYSSGGTDIYLVYSAKSKW